jgi:hypothetical protein
MNRTGRPPILDTTASLRSDADSTGPSGIPKNTDVSVLTSSSSSSDQSCRVDDAMAESLVYQPGMTIAMSPRVNTINGGKKKKKESQIRHEWK